MHESYCGDCRMHHNEPEKADEESCLAAGGRDKPVFCLLNT